MKKSHKIVLLVMLGLVVLCGVSGFVTYRIIGIARQLAALPPRPGEAQFNAADNQISAFYGETGLGETVEERAIARDFSKVMQEVTAKAFSGGHEATFDPTHGHVITFCRVGPQGCVLLVHVPKLNQYKDDVREALVALAWLSAQRTIRLNLVEPKAVAMGMRGTLLLGPIVIGGMEGKPTVSTSGLEERERLFPFFAPAAATTGGAAGSP